MAPFALNAEIGIAATRFKYDEFNDAGKVLDTEHGGIPGLSFKLGQRRSYWEWESIANYHYGRVDYTGQTNTGTPYNTRTDETISDAALRLGHRFDTRIPWMLYGGLGYRRWDRDILPGTVGGLSESYRWWYVWLGAKLMIVKNDQAQYVLDAGLLKPLNPELHVDYQGAYSISPVLHPESKTGLRVMFSSKLALSGNTYLILAPYYEYWKLGRSPTVYAGVISVYEPASKTNNIGFDIRLGRTF